MNREHKHLEVALADEFAKERGMLLATIEALVEANADLRRQLCELRSAALSIEQGAKRG